MINISRRRLAWLVALAAVPPLSHSSPLSAISRKMVSVSVEGCMIPRSAPWYCSRCAPQLGYNGHPKQCPHPPHKCFMKAVPGIHFTQFQFYIYYYYANVGKRLRLMLALMFYINAVISKLLYKV